MTCAPWLTTWTPAAAAWAVEGLRPTWAQAAGSAGQRVTEIYWALGAVIAAAAVIVLVALVVRRLMLRPEEPGAAEGFTLSDIRRLHREGALSDEEFAAARAALIAQGMAHLGPLDRGDDPEAESTDSDAPPTPPPPPESPPPDADADDSDKTGDDRPGRPRA